MENKREENEQNEQKNVMKKKRLLHIIWSILSKIITVLIIFICIIIVIQKVSNNKESFLGYRIFRVQTGSMIPKYKVGDVILVREKDIDKIKVGDDVTYLGEASSVKGMLITHRVIDIEEIDGQKAFHTKGIANNLCGILPLTLYLGFRIFKGRHMDEERE